MSAGRRHDLDALRGFAMLLGIGLHTSLGFFPSPWPIRDPQQSGLLGMFFLAIHGFRMPLFFIVSGYFTLMVCRKRGLAAFLKQRAVRILVPCLLGLVTLVPVTRWISAVARRTPSPPASATTLADAVRFRDSAGIDRFVGIAEERKRPDGELGITPLAWAVLRADKPLVERLLQAGADPNGPNRDGNRPLHAAAFAGREDLVRLLLERGADPAALNGRGEPPIVSSAADRETTRFIYEAIGMPPPDPQQLEAGRQAVRQRLAAAVGAARSAASSAPADSAPADSAPADSAPADSAPADSASADSAPANRESADASGASGNRRVQMADSGPTSSVALSRGASAGLSDVAMKAVDRGDASSAPSSPSERDDMAGRYWAWLHSAKWQVAAGRWTFHLFDSSTFLHLWFLWFLWWYAICFAAVWSVAGRWLERLPMRVLAWLLIAMTPLTMYWMGGGSPVYFGPDTSTSWLPYPHLFAFYGLFYAFGLAMYGWEANAAAKPTARHAASPSTNFSIPSPVTMPTAMPAHVPDASFADPPESSPVQASPVQASPVQLPAQSPPQTSVPAPVLSPATSPTTWSVWWLWPVQLTLALFVVFPFCVILAGRRELALAAHFLYVWLISLGLIGGCRALLGREWPLVRYLSDSSYWLYLAHLPLVMALQAVARTWPLGPLTKFAAINLIAVSLLLLSYHFLVRKTWLGWLLNGPNRFVSPAAVRVQSPG